MLRERSVDRRSLRELARMYGVQPAYYDVARRLCEASCESLRRVLQSLGAPLDTLDHAPQALRDRRRALACRTLEPVVVAWDGRASFRLQLAARDADHRFHCRVLLEDGGNQEWSGSFADLPTVRERTVDGERYVAKRLTLPLPLPLGYHRVSLEYSGRTAGAFVISAPERAYHFGEPGRVSVPACSLLPTAFQDSDRTSETLMRRSVVEQASSLAPPHRMRDRNSQPHERDADAMKPGERLWGVFLPLYALHRDSSWGAGDFSDLEALMNWVAEQGGSLVATLPLLASLFDVTGDPSPYSPATRLFWNEFYLDVTRISEFHTCREAREFFHSAATQSELRALRKEPYVDYRRQLNLQRQVLTKLSQAFFTARDPARREDFERFCREHPQAETYARFRAVAERLGPVWNNWPEPLRSGTIGPGDFDESVAQHHLYAQWQIEGQLRSLAEHARAKGLLWYLDFPLGVSGTGYDAWKQREVFALDASGGAPPDMYFTKGQNWGFPPLHPQHLREQEYRYLITAVRRHLCYARLLRFDHVMSLYRLYWVPNGLPAKDGVYVRYPADEWFAILTLESHRHQAEIVGENLGTVPEKVNRLMQRHGIHSMYVIQYETRPSEDAVLPPVSHSSVASLNTHDMPPFAAFWQGLDIDDRADLGLLNAEQADEERQARAKVRRAVAAFLRRQGFLARNRRSADAVLEACLAFLASSEAAVVLVNLEDLWGETHPQNTPGTSHERPNWRHKARHRFEKFRELPAVLRVLRTVDACRRRGESLPLAQEAVLSQVAITHGWRGNPTDEDTTDEDARQT